MLRKSKFSVLFPILLLLVISCNNDYTPKPRGYFRIDLPEHKFQSFDSVYPYRFEYPVYSKLVPKTDSLSEPYWINMVFPSFKGTLYLSYKCVNNDLNRFLEDSRTMAMKHIDKSTGIDEILIHDKQNKIFGMMYDIRGTDAASPLQFYLTDSCRHFLRGALYFNVVPNNDSLQPVIDFLHKDIDHLIKTLRWKN